MDEEDSNNNENYSIDKVNNGNTKLVQLGVAVFLVVLLKFFYVCTFRHKRQNIIMYDPRIGRKWFNG